jgi:hypothetical protein
MWFHSLLASWKSGLSRSRRPQPARRGARLVLERIEDRTLLSSYTALTAADLIADINAANAAGGANTITLAAKTGSPYVLTAVNNSTDGATGLPVIAATDHLTILGNGDTIERSTASGTPAFRLFDVAAGASLTLQSLTLQNGFAYGAGTGAEGGAVYNQGALDLNGVTVQGNIAQGYSGQAVGFTFIPAGPAEGGGIYSGGALTLAGTTVKNNQALGGNGLDGYGEAGCNGLGGGVFVAGGTATLTNDTLSSNTALGGQGGRGANPDIANVYPGGAGGNGFGGALEVSGGTVSLTSSTVSRNTAIGGAGGEGLPYGTPGAGEGGGVYIASGATVYLDSFTVKNTKNNTASIDPNIDGTYILL